MIFDTLYASLPQAFPSTTLPNIHPEDIQCVIRSELLTRGSLYVSNIQTVQNPATLTKLKVSSVLTCAQGYRLDHSQQLIRYYKYLPLSDNPVFQLNSYFDEATRFIKQTLERTNCVVHCLTGSNKSIAVIIAYLIKSHALNLNDAYAYVQKKIKLINLSPQYFLSLKEYEYYISNKNTNKSVSNYSNKNSSHTATLRSQKTENLETVQPQNFFVHDGARNNKTLKTNQSQLSQQKNHERLLSQCSNLSVKDNNSKIPNGSFLKTQKSQTRNKSMHKSHIKSTQKSQISDNKKAENQFQIQHKEAHHFSKILSSNHQEFVGVKRQCKNSTISLGKQKSNIFTNAKDSSIDQVSKAKYSMTQNSKQRVLSVGDEQDLPAKRDKFHKTQISHQNVPQYALRISSQNKSKILTQNSHRQASSRVKSSQKHSFQDGNYLNPEHVQDPEGSKKRKVSLFQNQGDQTVSPSKQKHFSQMNQEINVKIEQILTGYQCQMAQVRNRYHHNLRQLKFNAKKAK